MEALALLEKARSAGLTIAVDGDGLQVCDPRAAATVVEELRQHKAEIIAVLTAPPTGGFVSGLTEHAAHQAPVVRLSVRETDDGSDITLLRQLRTIIQEYQPGGNLVHVALRLQDGRVVVAQWLALACKELRMALGHAGSPRYGGNQWQAVAGNLPIHRCSPPSRQGDGA